MNIKNQLLKKLTVIITAAMCFSSSGLIAQAQALDDESNAAYEWSGEQTKDTEAFALYASEPVWTLEDDKDVAVDPGTINLKSYTMTLLNDTRLCKGVSKHSSYFRGYVRARFETLFGEVHAGSDSGRVVSYYGTTAETPGSASAGGWNGVAHTYCGTDF